MKDTRKIIDMWKAWAKEEGRDEEDKNNFANYYANSYEEYMRIWEVIKSL